jgi:serine palmitoyltransferase
MIITLPTGNISSSEFIFSIPFRLTGENTVALNLSSYNYLGFAENSGPVIDQVLESVDNYSFATSSARMEAGRYSVVEELEKTVAKFVGKPAAMVFGMGYATNSTTIPALTGKGSLIISDSLNHASIVCGSKDSGAKIIVFKHNDVEDLEKVLRQAIVEGQPRTHRPWKKIVIIVEGIYSMEGEILKLPEIVALKKKYKAYLYVDEAHSIGALGKTGRGVCEHWGVNPDDIDILMGTFTKAFGSVGGYISGSHELVEYLRNCSYAQVYAPAMAPPCAKQALAALRVITGEDGTNQGQQRLARLHDNANFFRSELRRRGFHAFGDPDSPIVPMMVYHPAKMPGISRALLERGVIVVLVGFPVTPLLLSRVRFCLSSAHSREDLEFALKHIDELGDLLFLKYNKNKVSEDDEDDDE